MTFTRGVNLNRQHPGGPRSVPTAEPVEIRTLAAVTCFYNPCGYRRPVENYDRFQRHLQAEGVPLYTIELAYDDAPFQFQHHRIRQVRGDRRLHLLWQKERLLNLLIAELCDSYDALLWIDADCLLLRPGWPRLIRETLGDYVVCQPFSQSWSLLPGGKLDVHKQWSTAAAFHHKPEIANHFGHTHPGFAWAARSQFFQRGGRLLESNVTGGGDSLMCRGFTGLVCYDDRRLNDPWRKQVDRWVNRTQELAGRSLGYVAGPIVHLYHGTKQNRRYVERWKYQTEYDFDPHVDVEVDADNGLLRWTNRALREKPAMIRKVGDYFAQRQEDD